MSVEAPQLFQVTFLEKKICLIIALLHALLKFGPDNARSYQSQNSFLSLGCLSITDQHKLSFSFPRKDGDGQVIAWMSFHRKKIKLGSNSNARFLLLFLETRSNSSLHFAEVTLSLEDLHSHCLSWRITVVESFSILHRDIVATWCLQEIDSSLCYQCQNSLKLQFIVQNIYLNII